MLYLHPTSHNRALIFVRACLLLCVCSPARADNGWEGRILSLSWDNDALAGTDRHYTEGARISYLSKDDALPKWTGSLSDFLPSLGFEPQARKYGLELGQEIYTPEDLHAAAVVENDRPYAGWLYARASLIRRGESFASSIAMETLSLDLGIVGPGSGAEITQKTLHSKAPAGWRHQLKNEPGVDLRYDRRRLFEAHFDDWWRLQFIPSLAASAGNVDTHMGVGGTVRFGYNVPNEFEVPAGATPYKFGAYVFSGAEGRWVIRNIFLDGNTFRSSHHVDKEPLVGDLKLGVGLVLKRFEVILSHTFLTHEFKAQDKEDSFSSATLLFKF